MKNVATVIVLASTLACELPETPPPLNPQDLLDGNDGDDGNDPTPDPRAARRGRDPLRHRSTSTTWEWRMSARGIAWGGIALRRRGSDDRPTRAPLSVWPPAGP